MHAAIGKRTSAAALLAALILVVQAALSAWAGTAMAGEPMLDAFGNPICIGGTVSDGGGPVGDHGKVVDCCTLGCSGFSQALPDADRAVRFVVAPRLSDTFAPVGRPAIRVPAFAHDPGSPRAPPLHV